MQQDSVICGLLEGLAAEALSTSVDDDDSIGSFGLHLRHALTEEMPPEACEALKLGIFAVARIRSGGESNATEIMKDIAEGLVAAAAGLNSPGRPEPEEPAGGDAADDSDQSDRSPYPTSYRLSDSEDIDAELLKDFSVECIEHVNGSEAAMLSLETGGDCAEVVDTVLRAFHTIKGAAGFMGIEPIQDLAHLAEDLLTEARDGSITLVGQYADLVFRTCDMLKEMISPLALAQPGQVMLLPPGLDELLEDLSASMSGQGARAAQPAKPTQQFDRQEIETPSPPPAGEPAKTECSELNRPSVQDQSVRVSIDRLDSLVNMAGELVVAHSMISQDPDIVNCGTARLGRSIQQAGKIIRELQDLATALRMVPLRSTFQKVSRAVRELDRMGEKSVRLVVEGEDTEIDRHMVEALTDPLIHMIRNAIDHGLESPDDRTRAGKSAFGTIRLSACHSAGRVRIELRDDGRGLNRDRIMARAIECGLAASDAELSDAELFAMIFEPGFSTAERVTEVSGRGVGMDVVKRNIASLHGRIEVASIPGKGATFAISLPLTLAITDVMAVRVGSEEFLLPMIAIERAFRPAPKSVSSAVGVGELVMHRDEILPLFRLHCLLDIDGAVTEPTEALAIIFTGCGRRCAIMVDDLLGHRQAVIKSLGNAMQGAKETAGGVILADGRVGLILDPDNIVALAMDSVEHTNTIAV